MVEILVGVERAERELPAVEVVEPVVVAPDLVKLSRGLRSCSTLLNKSIWLLSGLALNMRCSSGTGLDPRYSSNVGPGIQIAGTFRRGLDTIAIPAAAGPSGFPFGALSNRHATAPARCAACARGRCRHGGRAGPNHASRGAHSTGGVGLGRGLPIAAINHGLHAAGRAVAPVVEGQLLANVRAGGLLHLDETNNPSRGTAAGPDPPCVPRRVLRDA